MDIGKFIEKCFEIGIALLKKQNLSREEKDFLRLLDEFEEWAMKN